MELSRLFSWANLGASVPAESGAAAIARTYHRAGQMWMREYIISALKDSELWDRPAIMKNDLLKAVAAVPVVLPAEFKAKR